MSVAFVLASSLAFSLSSVRGDEVRVTEEAQASDLSDEEFESSVPCELLNVAAPSERVFLFSTRHLPFDACHAPLDAPPFKVWQIHCGQSQAMDCDQYLASLHPGRPVVVYVHGNRMPASNIVNRAMQVRRTIQGGLDQPVDWLIFSWPSAKEGIAVHDVRRKADRCDAQSLYLATLLRMHVVAGTPMAVVGFSFGGRVVTGSLHALAGGGLSGRTIPGETIQGANINVGLVAPAIESTWLGSCGYHCLATKNMDQLSLMYNRSDAILKRYWLLEKVRNQTALGYSGPRCFAPRVDGSKLPVRARDFSGSVRLRHAELEYYENGCGCDFARLIRDAGNQTY
ncbi:hypothetical protein CGZ80_17940 [Rhodopirellula sp. MGV]|nr:hypothetical protein CGZ80_17940 [Rhodopirellula sp. MGV]PNY35161.1 alpha/beta hydrolase [Rhodopirellula baltica]